LCNQIRLLEMTHAAMEPEQKKEDAENEEIQSDH